MLERIFLQIIGMSRAAGIIIVIVCIVRMLLKRFPKYISCLLWSIVLFRLFCPAAWESQISPIPGIKPAFYADMSKEDIAAKGQDALLPDGLTIPYPDDKTANIPETEQITDISFLQEGNDKAAETSWQALFLLFGKYVWAAGTGFMFLYCAVSFVKIRRRVSTAIPLKENIYMTDKAIPPFVMGIIHPRIYLPEGLDGQEQEYIILHEKLHIRRLDNIVKPVAFAALCIHWFNPLVWIAFFLFCKDMEMSCDEAVIKKLGEAVKADYSASLLALSTQRRMIRGMAMHFGEGNTKERIQNLAAFRRRKKGVLAVLLAGVAVLIVCLASTRKTSASDIEARPENEVSAGENRKTSKEHSEPEQLTVSLDITEHYITHKGDPSNLYYIDEDNVLWGSGRNEYGQLGQGTQDYDFHEDMVKIAENVIHVDYSPTGFVIFLTKEHQLYGMGNAGCGALQQHDTFDWWQRVNGEEDVAAAPVLLMEDVIYASCGRDDIVSLKEDGSVWIWGTIYAEGNYASHNVYFVEKPTKILENAVLVTGGWFHHAALLQDGTVWTWGYNGAGNCGVADLTVVGEPAMVAEGVVMVWTDIAVDLWQQPEADDLAMAWRGDLRYAKYETIAEFDDIYPRLLDNMVIRKADGSYWVCGEHVGTEERVVHGAEGDYSVICTHEFYPCG